MDEWKTFRNLLDDGCVDIVDGKYYFRREWRYHSALPLEKPGNVIDSLLNCGPAFVKPGADKLKNSFDISTLVSLGGVEFESVGLGL